MKKRILLIAAGVVLLAALLVGFIWWHLPTVFLADVAPADVARIEVFNGTRGKSFVIEDAADIEYIVTNIQRTKMYKEEWEIKDGFVYSLSFYAADGSRMAHLELNGEDSIRDGNMEYECEYDALCFGYIKDIEARQ